MLLELLVDTLIHEGFTVFEAKNGQTGLKLARQKKPDLILLDVMMPKMNGMTMLKKLRADKAGQRVPVIVLTNVGDSQNLIEALEFDTCQLELSQNKGAVSKVSHQGIKTYLNARLKGGVTEYLIKSNLKLTDVIKKVKQILR